MKVQRESPSSVESNKSDESVITKEEDTGMKEEAGQLEIRQSHKRKCVFGEPYLPDERMLKMLKQDFDPYYDDWYDDSSDDDFAIDYSWEPTKKFREDGILQSARRTAGIPPDENKEKFFGADVICRWFRKYPPSPVEFVSNLKLDGESLKSQLHDSIYTVDSGHPDWDELAKYVKQLRDSDEGFDLGEIEYKKLGDFTDGLPVSLNDKELHANGKVLQECIAAAMRLYEEAGGGKLEEEKLIKANGEWGSSHDIFYITFTAKSCLDGKERVYQAEVLYDGVDIRGVDESEVMIRLKKGSELPTISS